MVATGVADGSGSNVVTGIGSGESSLSISIHAE